MGPAAALREIRVALGLEPTTTNPSTVERVKELCHQVVDAQKQAHEDLFADIEMMQDLVKTLAESIILRPDTTDARKIAMEVLGKTKPSAPVFNQHDGWIHSSHWGVRHLALSLRRSLGPAPNYVEMSMHDADGQMIVTVQRCEGKTPHTLQKEAEQQRDAARAEVVRLAAEIERLQGLLAVQQ